MAPPFESEDKLLRFLDRVDEEGGATKGDLNRRIDENVELFRGKQWKGRSAPAFLYNVIESSLEDKHGKLSESKPQIKVLPAHNGLGAAAEILTKCTQSIWDRSKMEYKTERVALWGSLAGAAFVGTVFNSEKQDIDLIVKDPRACTVDCSVTSGEDADFGEYVSFEDLVPIDIVRSQYQGRGALVKPDVKINGYDTSTDKSVAQRIRGAYSRLTQKNQPEKVSAIPKAIIREYFIQDRRKNIQDLGVVPIVEKLTKYQTDGVPFPGGRRIIRAGEIILEDSFNPYFDGLPPVDMLSWKLDPETAWAADEVQSVRRLQEAVNRLGDGWVKTGLLNSVVRLVMDSGALSPAERNKLSNEVGQIIEKNPGRELEYMVPQLLSMDVLNAVNIFIGFMRQKLGVQEIPMAKDVPSIVTGPAIEGLQVMVQTPIRTAARRLEEFYSRLGQKLISRVFQYWTSDRMLQLVGEDAKWVQFEFQRMKILVDAKGKPRSQSDLQKAFKDFVFVVEPGSSLASTKTQRAMMKFQLAQAGWIHPREVLLELGIQNVEEKLKDAAKAKEQGLLDVIMGGKGSGANFAGMGGRDLAA